MMPDAPSPQSQHQLRLVDGGQVTALQKPMTDVAQVDVNGCGGGIEV